LLQRYLIKRPAVTKRRQAVALQRARWYWPVPT